MSIEIQHPELRNIYRDEVNALRRVLAGEQEKNRRLERDIQKLRKIISKQAGDRRTSQIAAKVLKIG